MEVNKVPCTKCMPGFPCKEADRLWDNVVIAYHDRNREKYLKALDEYNFHMGRITSQRCKKNEL